MTNVTEEKEIRIILFNGKQATWRMWSRKFLAQVSIKGYKDLMLGKEKLPTPSFLRSTEDIDTVEQGIEEKKMSMNRKAYNELLLCCQDEISFGAVDEAISDEYPDGNCQEAWSNLLDKYEPRTTTTKVELKKKFAEMKLPQGSDPDIWINKLEQVRQLLRNTGHKMSEEDLLIHILNNMTIEYETLVERLEPQIDSLDVKKVWFEIRQKYNRISKYSAGSDSPDKALAGFKPNTNNNSNNNKQNSTNKKPNGKRYCNYCKKPGHTENKCYAKKDAERNKNNKYCTYHKSNSHSTEECHALKKLR